jgi:uncharacterized phosphosugar-binding protein
MANQTARSARDRIFQNNIASSPCRFVGKKLIDVADVILDNQCPPGDCVVEMEGLEWRTGPTSTVTGT